MIKYNDFGGVIKNSGTTKIDKIITNWEQTDTLCLNKFNNYIHADVILSISTSRALNIKAKYINIINIKS